MNLLPDQKVKSFWERPEGKTGGFFMVGILAGLGYVLYKSLPYIITLLQNTLYAVGLGIALFAVITILLDKNFRNGCWYLYKLLMRQFTGWVVTIDPIEIMKIHIEKLRERREEMNQKIALLKGQQVKLERTLADNQDKAKKAMIIADQAEKDNNKGMVGVKTREFGMFKSFNERLEPMRKKLEDLHQFLSKLYESSGYIIVDMENQIYITELEFKSVRESSNAIRSAKSIFSGGDDEMYKRAIDFVADDISNRVGEIDQFMRNTESIIKGLDYENGAFESEGMKMLEEFKSSDFTFLLNKDLGKVPNAPEKIMIPKVNTTKTGGISGLLD